MGIEYLKKKMIINSDVEILEENITENDNEIIFEFILNKNVPITRLSELWNPGSDNKLIINKLREKGWISDDLTNMLHFKMDIAVNKEEKKVKFRYYRVDSAINEGLKQRH